MFTFLRLYVNCWKTWQSRPVAAWVKGALLYKKGLFGAAISLYEKGLAANPRHAARFSARMDLAFCQMKVGDYAGAEANLRWLTGRMPTQREPHMRLIKLKLWQDLPLEAAWMARRAIRKLGADADLVGLYLYAVLEAGGNYHLADDVLRLVRELPSAQRQGNVFLQGMVARYNVLHGDKVSGFRDLNQIASSSGRDQFEVVQAHAGLLLERGAVALARQALQHALCLRPGTPVIHAMLARTYLASGESYNPQFAAQHALDGCKNSGWRSAQCMHIYAEALYRIGDRLTALAVAQKAKTEGSRILAQYSAVGELDQLISDLSDGISLVAA